MALDLDAYYRKYGPMVLRRCRKLLKNEEKAVDAMHDVFVELVRRKDRLDGTAPAALLQRVATNVCLNRIRGERRRTEEPADDLLVRIAGSGEPDPEERLSARRFLARIFGRESESTRAIAVMHLLDGMTLEEVASEVNLSVSGVRKRLRTMKARIAELEEV